MMRSPSRTWLVACVIDCSVLYDALPSQLGRRLTRSSISRRHGCFMRYNIASSWTFHVL